MIRIPKQAKPGPKPLNTLRMPARWWAEAKAAALHLALPHTSGEAILISMEAGEDAFRDRYAHASEDHLAEAVRLYYEAYRVTWDRLSQEAGTWQSS